MARKARRSTQSDENDQGGRIVAYVRVSTLDQVTDGVSLDAQREKLLGYAIAHDLELVAIEADEGISGKVAPSQRPGLSAALSTIERGDADGLLVVKLDRAFLRAIAPLADIHQTRLFLHASSHPGFNREADDKVISV